MANNTIGSATGHVPTSVNSDALQKASKDPTVSSRDRRTAELSVKKLDVFSKFIAGPATNIARDMSSAIERVANPKAYRDFAKFDRVPDYKTLSAAMQDLRFSNFLIREPGKPPQHLLVRNDAFGHLGTQPAMLVSVDGKNFQPLMQDKSGKIILPLAPDKPEATPNVTTDHNLASRDVAYQGVALRALPSSASEVVLPRHAILDEESGTLIVRDFKHLEQMTSNTAPSANVTPAASMTARARPNELASPARISQPAPQAGPNLAELFNLNPASTTYVNMRNFMMDCIAPSPSNGLMNGERNFTPAGGLKANGFLVYNQETKGFVAFAKEGRKYVSQDGNQTPLSSYARQYPVNVLRMFPIPTSGSSEIRTERRESSGGALPDAEPIIEEIEIADIPLPSLDVQDLVNEIGIKGKVVSQGPLRTREFTTQAPPVRTATIKPSGREGFVVRPPVTRDRADISIDATAAAMLFRFATLKLSAAQKELVRLFIEKSLMEGNLPEMLHEEFDYDLAAPDTSLPALRALLAEKQGTRAVLIWYPNTEEFVPYMAKGKGVEDPVFDIQKRNASNTDLRILLIK